MQILVIFILFNLPKDSPSAGDVGLEKLGSVNYHLPTSSILVNYY